LASINFTVDSVKEVSGYWAVQISLKLSNGEILSSALDDISLLDFKDNEDAINEAIRRMGHGLIRKSEIRELEIRQDSTASDINSEESVSSVVVIESLDDSEEVEEVSDEPDEEDSEEDTEEDTEEDIQDEEDSGLEYE